MKVMRTHTHTHMHTQMTCNVADSGTLSTPGKGCVYSFDPVGSYERETYRAGGSSASMLQPLLDNQVSLQLWWRPSVSLAELVTHKLFSTCNCMYTRL